MKSFIQILLSIFFIFIISCSNNSGVNSSDDIIDKVLGQWAFGNTKTIFKSDGVYNDSTFAFPNQPEYLLMVIKGKYNISRNILTKSDLQIVFLDSLLLDNPSYSSFTSYRYDYKIISITDSLITFRLAEELVHLSGPLNSLWSDWSLTKWIIHSENNNLYTGRMKQYFSFYKDSSHFDYKVEYLDGIPLSASNDKKTFEYNPPILETNGVKKTVEFNQGYMHWLYTNINYTRIK